jgi:hypothetical protein
MTADAIYVSGAFVVIRNTFNLNKLTAYEFCDR